MQKRLFQLTFAALAVASLVGCGGGSGGNDPVVVTTVALGGVSSDLTINPGEPFSFTATADSPDRALSNLSWTMQATANAPALITANLNCSTIEKTDTPQQNGLVSSLWRCSVSGAAPNMLASDATYSLIASASNSANSVASAVSTLRVKAPSGGAELPKVFVDGPSIAAGGSSQEFDCSAKGGYAPNSNYTYAWTGTSPDQQQIVFDDKHAAKVHATLPTFSAAESVLITCAATDEADKTGTYTVPVQVQQDLPTAKITGTTSGKSGESIAMTCEASGGYVPTGSSYKYQWTSNPVGGASLSFDSTTRDVVSVTLPTVTSATTIIASCTVTDTAGKTGQASSAVQVSP